MFDNVPELPLIALSHVSDKGLRRLSGGKVLADCVEVLRNHRPVVLVDIGIGDVGCGRNGAGQDSRRIDVVAAHRNGQLATAAKCGCNGHAKCG